jgi:hypothetical protein
MDPFAVLGLDDRATVEEIRSARRRLAFEAHPDRGGDARRMQQINEAHDAAVAELAHRAAAADDPVAPAPDAPPPSSGPSPRRGRVVDHEAASFVVHCLPVDAFEALLVCASWLGEVVDDDPPYRLDVHLEVPASCWCRLDLVPDAGASTVSITVAWLEDTAWPAPTVEEVRDVWIGALNELGGQ